MAKSYYSRVLLPCLCDFLLDRPFVNRLRQELLVPAEGAILEIGFGTGLNLPRYPSHVHKLITVDPNPGMLRRARKRIQASGLDVEQYALSGEKLPFHDHQFDTVVSTFTLCSIPKIEDALKEVHRVLRPGGRFLFLEHGLSPDPMVQKWQHRLNWLEMRLGDGCRLTSNIRQMVATQPFAGLDVQEFYLAHVPKTHGYLYRGMARK